MATATGTSTSTEAGTGTGTGVRLRADAVRNRERIVDAARGAFVQFGPEVPLDEVARLAGVGNATLYRHFPDRESLVHHVVLAVMARVTERAETAAAEEADAFEALHRFVLDAAEERVGALCPVLTAHIDKDDPEVLTARKSLESATERLMESARCSGQLRTDVAFGDLMLALTQLARPLPGQGCPEIARFAHRHLQIFLDGLRTPARSELPGSAATFDDLRSHVSARAQS